MEIQTTGKRLKQLMKEQDLRQVDILKKTEPYQKKYEIPIGKSDLSQYVNDKVQPRKDKLFILSLALNVSEAWLLGYDNSQERPLQNVIPEKIFREIYSQLSNERQNKVYNYAKYQLEDQKMELREINQKYKAVNLVGVTSANPEETQYADPIYDEFIDTNVPSKADRALIVKGDSMEPDYFDGDIVFYRIQPDVENGEIAIVEIDGSGVTCKKVIKEDSKIILRSLNKKYEDREVEPSRIRIIGKVVS